MLFAISTAISWSYYGDRSANYLLGSKAVLPYKLAFVGAHFVGAVLPLAAVWGMGDVFLAIVILPNLLALVLLAPKVVEMTNDYFERKPWVENEEKRKQWKTGGAEALDLGSVRWDGRPGEISWAGRSCQYRAQGSGSRFPRGPPDQPGSPAGKPSPEPARASLGMENPGRLGCSRTGSREPSC